MTSTTGGCSNSNIYISCKSITYASTLNLNTAKHQKIQLKPIQYLHGEPRLIWEEEEIAHMILEEDLQYVGEVNIGLLCNIYVLIRASNLEDYVTLMSKSQFYRTQKHWSYLMRTLKWDLLFDPQEETTTTIAWISFPTLPPNFFGKDAIFSLAAAVDMATQNKTRPNCVRVKVEVDL
ncbi:hypothetical protein H5410_015900 [Solanum commersonii]|uniref:DUF4283 domain-containing protein n=1 Tax=Solanum commersonii TaxID=4109 RepID=A0A9J5ZVS6_SOLCO|nr:hypothetical protein H5410_015900 [Solanum commersonii]